MSRTTPNVFKGTFQNRDLFLQAFHNWNKAHNVTQAVYKTVAEASGLTMDVLHRLVNGTKDSREAGYELQPSPEIARVLEDFYSVARGTWGGKDPVPDAPLNGLEDMTPEVAVPEPTPRPSKAHTVLGVTGADLEETGKDAVEAGFYLVPLDKLGEWGKLLISLVHPYLRDKAIANQLPILVEQSENFGTLVFTAPLPTGQHKTTTCPAATVAPLLETCKRISGQEAIFAITEIYTAFAGVRMEEVKNKALAKATLQDQLAGIRQHLGDLSELVLGMGTLGTKLQDAEHDVVEIVGVEHTVSQALMNILANYEALRQGFRMTLRQIQGNSTK